MDPHAAHRTDATVGPLIRQWRTARGRSQLDLAPASNGSQRHLSFIESGRSRPSRPMLLNLAEVLDVPLRERNTLLLAAGYAPVYADGAWDAPEMARVNTAIDRMLRQHAPYPALVMDRHWNVLRTNDAAPRLFGRFIDLGAFPKPRNLLRLVFDPHGLRPHLEDWDRLAPTLIGRVHREAVGRVIDDGTRRLLDDLMRYPGVQPQWQRPEAASSLPTTPLGLRHADGPIRYFSMVSTIGTPQTVLTQELRLECMFPADEASDQRHLALMA